MNHLLPRFVTRAYRQEPISAFVFTVGIVNALIGGLGERWSLLSFGLFLGGSAIALRWLQNYQKRTVRDRPNTTRYLTGADQRSPDPLPPLRKIQSPPRRP